MYSRICLLFLLSMMGGRSYADNTAYLFGEPVDPNNKNTSQDAECRDLQPGQSKVVADTAQQSATGVGRHYKITRDKDNPNQMNVDLNIRFLPQVVKGQSIQDWVEAGDAKSKEFQAKANNCFQQYKNKLVDRDGTQLNITVFTNKPNSDVPENLVGIVGNENRDDSGNWTASIDCPTIIHESLHLAGLVDGYVEKVLKNDDGSLKYDCRHIEKGDSIMKDQWQALTDKVDLMVCNCRSPKCKSDKSSAEQGDSTSMTCPQGYAATETNKQIPVDAAESWLGNLPYSRGFIVKIKTYNKTAQPALKKGQVMSITKPRCTRNNAYMDCARNAYRSSSSPGGCLDTAPDCKSGRWSQ